MFSGLGFAIFIVAWMLLAVIFPATVVCVHFYVSMKGTACGVFFIVILFIGYESVVSLRFSFLYNCLK